MKKFNQPPLWADHFLQWFCAEELLEEIQGDLYEAYQARLQERSKWYANYNYIIDVFAFFQPYTFEKYSRTKQYLPMFDNYLKITLRNIIHRKNFTAINFISLTVGVTAIMLIGLYLQNEFSYDKSTPEHERIYRLMNHYRDQIYSSMSFKGSGFETQLILSNHLKAYEEIEEVCHFVPSQTPISNEDQFLITFDQKRFIEENLLFTNQGNAFQNIFPQAFLLGSPATAFSNFNNIILTESIAEKWFGTDWMQQQILGKSLLMGEEVFELTGVISDIPQNKHFDFNLIVHQKLIPSWGAYTYLKLKSDVDIESVLTQLNSEVDQVYPGYSEDELSKGITAVALADIHFTEGNLYELKETANMNYLLTFGMVGFIILLIIWTNYTNLSIAMSADRQKELGMRKVLGARVQDISFQLLMEAILLAVLCFPICWMLLRLWLPHFNKMMDLELPISMLWNIWTMLILLGLLFFTGLLSGLYPALVYSNRSMLRLFGKRKKQSVGNRFLNLRNGLVTVQFVMVISLLSFTYFINQQLTYVSNKNLGFQKEGVISFPIDGAEKFNQLKTKLSQVPEIESIGANAVPGAAMVNQLTYKMRGGEDTFADANMEYLDMGNFQTLNIDCLACEQLKNGKERVFVINQTAAKKLAKTIGSTTNDLIGKTIITEPEYENEEHGFGIPYVVDGIVEDYNFHSLKTEVKPMLIHVFANIPWVYEIMLRANTDDWKITLDKIELAYLEVEPIQTFDYTFLEARLDKLYTAEQRSRALMLVLSLVALVLAFSGLAGVVSYIAISRQKEIGIRKVLGASVNNILLYFNREFIILMGIATIIALPCSLYLINRWLEGFAYRIIPQFWVVILAAFAALLLVLLLVTFQSRNAARKHPVEVLKAD